ICDNVISYVATDLAWCLLLFFMFVICFFFFFSSRRRHTRFSRDWSSDVCSSDLAVRGAAAPRGVGSAGSGDPSGPRDPGTARERSEERRVGKSVDLGGRPMIKKKMHVPSL